MTENQTKESTLLRIIYITALSPLITGSATFFYWFYQRKWFAESVQIKTIAFFIIVAYFLLGLITLILAILFIFKYKSRWTKILLPVLIVFITFHLISLYDNLQEAFEEKTFLQIVNNTNLTVTRVWSDSFQLEYLDKEGNDFVISFYPIYTYDWNHPSSIGENHTIHPVYITLRESEGKEKNYLLPTYYKGSCATLLISELLKKK